MENERNCNLLIKNNFFHGNTENRKIGKVQKGAEFGGKSPFGEFPEVPPIFVKCAHLRPTPSKPLPLPMFINGSGGSLFAKNAKGNYFLVIFSFSSHFHGKEGTIGIYRK